jgi:hypothetical protein
VVVELVELAILLHLGLVVSVVVELEVTSQHLQLLEQ